MMALRNCLFLVLMFAGPTLAAVFTVGPSGTHSTVQGAINAAIMMVGDDEIMVAAGTYDENLTINPNGTGERIDLSGGWDGSFSVQSPTPPSVIDGGLLDRVLNVSLGAGDVLTLEQLTIQNGSAGAGAGLGAFLAANSILRIDRCRILNNVAPSPRSTGAGMRVNLIDSSHFELTNSTIDSNQAICSGDIDCRGGGMELGAADEAQVLIRNSRITNNSVSITSGPGFSAGAGLNLSGNSTLEFIDNQVSNNTVTGTGTGGNGVGLTISSDGAQTLRRNTITGNHAVSALAFATPQVSFGQFGNQIGIFSDSLIADGNGKGIVAFVAGAGTPVMHLSNLTVANHADNGIQISSFAAAGTANLSNSISVDNGTNAVLGATINSANNLLSGAAGFVNAALGNYALSVGSPAVDAGTNAPPGGLGPNDITGGTRIVNGTVDIGAYELDRDLIFSDEFE